MPSLIRFLSFLGLLAAAVCGGMVAFAGLVEPTQREFVVLVPQDRMGKKVVSNSRRRTGRAGGPTGDVEEGWVPVGCCPSWSEHLDHGNLVAVSSVGSKCPALVSMMCSASSPGDAVVSSRRAGSGAQAPLSTGTILPGERFRTLGLRADLEPAPAQQTCVAQVVSSEAVRARSEATMGLLDVLNGMRNGPRGQRDPATAGGGMSPVTMAVLGLLAYKALKNFGGNRPSPAGSGPSAGPAMAPGGSAMPGGLAGLLSGGLGGLLAGGAAGSILSGGLADLVRKFQQSGHGDVVNSWVGPGSNKAIAPNDLANALGAERINALTAQTGMSRDELLAGLSEELPQAVDELTPEGRLPNEQGRRVGFRRAGRSGSAGHGAGIRGARPTR